VGLEVARQLAREFDVGAIIDSGDLTTFGSPLEGRFARLLEDFDVPYVLVGGNHDSEANREALARPGPTDVLDFAETELLGLEVLGVGHPSFTASNELSEEELLADLEAQAPRVRAEVRRQTPDVLVVHDPRQADAAIGEVPLVLAGHVHRKSYSVVDGTIVLTVGSTGATGLGSFTVDRDLAYEAEILHFDADGLVAVDNIAFRGTNGNFRVERRLVDREAVADSANDDAGERPGLLGAPVAATARDAGSPLWCPVPL
jgi:3',5'-cyclic AMP phosphodiesterase CpdA